MYAYIYKNKKKNIKISKIPQHTIITSVEETTTPSKQLDIRVTSQSFQSGIVLLYPGPKLHSLVGSDLIFAPNQRLSIYPPEKPTKTEFNPQKTRSKPQQKGNRGPVPTAELRSSSIAHGTSLGEEAGAPKPRFSGELSPNPKP